jgi:uncharacterized membrane protein YgaE (UPF0421/DUF939 family)
VTATGGSKPPRGNAFLRRLADARAAPARYAKVIQAPDRTPLLQVVKTAVAATIAWFVCLLVLPSQLPVFAAVAAIIVVQPSVNQSFTKALERSFGVIIGVIIAYFAGVIFGASSWLILLAILIALLTGWALRLSQAATVQIPISAMLVLAIGAQTPGYAVDRILETILGATVAFVVNLVIVPPVRLQPAHDALSALGRELANTMDSLARLIQEPSTAAERNGALVEARLLAAMLTKARAAIKDGEESLRLNPRGQSHRKTLEREAALLPMLNVLVTRLPGMVRALDDHYDETLHSEPTAAGLGDELSRAAHDLRLVIEQAELPDADTAVLTDELPTLTAPFSVVAPSPRHWVLIGSLLEDLRRVHEVIVELSESRTS